jgi:hypothetical protein
MKQGQESSFCGKGLALNMARSYKVSCTNFVSILCTMQVCSRILSWSHVKLNDLNLIKEQFKVFVVILIYKSRMLKTLASDYTQKWKAYYYLLA